jgi:predicted nuclease with RNAse H fold
MPPSADQRGSAEFTATPELGAVRCAELLARRTGLPVRPAAVRELAARGMLQVTRHYKQRPLYQVTQVEALAADPLSRAVLAEIVGVV